MVLGRDPTILVAELVVGHGDDDAPLPTDRAALIALGAQPYRLHRRTHNPHCREEVALAAADDRVAGHARIAALASGSRAVASERVDEQCGNDEHNGDDGTGGHGALL